VVGVKWQKEATKTRQDNSSASVSVQPRMKKKNKNTLKGRMNNLSTQNFD
jgi:hypothetical protein